jgi:uncharacterized protein
MDSTIPCRHTTPGEDHPAVHSVAGPILMVAPFVLIATTYVAYNGFVGLFGFRTGYFLGFLFKWGIWCIVVPLWLLGRRGVMDLFRSTSPRVGRPAWLGWTLLALPLVVGYGYAFPRVLPMATLALVLLSAGIALVNGTLEEVFWRGTYARTFPGDPVRAWLYPSVGFGLWHLAPQSVSTGMGNPGGVVAFAGLGGRVYLP